MSDQPLPPPDPGLLEQRLRRLEDSLAQLQDLRQLEDRVTERLTRRLTPPPGGNIMDAPPRPLPNPAVLSHPTNVYADPAYATLGHGLLLDMLAEARAMVRMFVDPRYNLGWFARLVPLVLIVAIVTSLIWIPGIHLMPDWIAQVVSKIVDLILAYFLFKILIREARRYRETAPDLPPSLRL
jgi:hypothetical protein